MDSGDLRKILGAANDAYGQAMGIPSPARYEPRVMPETVTHPPQVWSVFDTFSQTFVEDELYSSKAAAISASARLNGAYARAMAP